MAAAAVNSGAVPNPASSSTPEVTVLDAVAVTVVSENGPTLRSQTTAQVVESQVVTVSPASVTYKLGGTRWMDTTEARKCGNVSESRGGLTDCVLEAGHLCDHLRKAGLRSGSLGHGEGYQWIARTCPPCVPNEAPPAKKEAEAPAEAPAEATAEKEAEAPKETPERAAMIRKLITELEDHWIALTACSKHMVRVVDGWTFDLHASFSSRGQSAVQLTTPDGSTKYLPKGQIPRAAAAHYRNFSTAELERRVNEGLHVTVCAQQALDPLMKRLLATPGSNVQQEDHFAALPPLGTGAGKTIDAMTDAELKGFVVQGQEEINRREVNHAVARGQLEAERANQEKREELMRMGAALKRKAEALDADRRAFEAQERLAEEDRNKRARVLDLRQQELGELQGNLKQVNIFLEKVKSSSLIDVSTTPTA